ncbi:MAG: hypothetical protein HYS06_06270 [Methylocystis sp.]|nr:hypothetical protein [Methylocystis sp.]
MSDDSGAPAGLKFEDREQLKAWLNTQPREVCVAIAARAALRVAVFATWEIAPRGGKQRTESFLNVTSVIFCATALARVAAVYPTRANELSAYARAAYARAAASIATAYDAGNAAVYAARAGTDADPDFTAVGFAVAAVDFAADAAADAATATAIWAEVSADARALARGESLAATPLWALARPDWSREEWERLKAALPENENWQVWIDWYEDRIDGRAYGEAKEFVFATVPEQKWNEGPAAANRWIKEKLDKLARREGKSEVPPPRPATIEPVVRNGKMVLPKTAPAADLDTRSLGASLRALKAQFAELAGDLEGEANIDQRLVAYLRNLGERLPTRKPNKDTLFSLGHQLPALRGYDKTVAEEWPELLASRYFALTLAFDQTWRQFPKWREFARNATEPLSPQQIEATATASVSLAEVLRQEEIAQVVDSAIPKALETLAAPLQEVRAGDGNIPAMAEAARQETALDVQESMNNVLKLAALNALAARGKGLVRTAAGGAASAGRAAARWGAKKVKDGAKNFDKGLDKGIAHAAKSAGYALGVGAIAVLSKAIGGSSLESLMTEFPNRFGWLKHLLESLGLH